MNLGHRRPKNIYYYPLGPKIMLMGHKGPTSMIGIFKPKDLNVYLFRYSLVVGMFNRTIVKFVSVRDRSVVYNDIWKFMYIHLSIFHKL